MTNAPTAPTEIVRIGAQVEADLAAALTEKAKAADRSLAGEIRRALKAWVEEREPEKAAA